MAQMEVEVESIVVHPDRPREVAGHREQLPPEPWSQPKPSFHDPFDVVVGEVRAVLPRPEDRQSGNMHVHAGFLEVEEARVESRQSLHRHGPMLGSGAMRRLATSMALVALLLVPAARRVRRSRRMETASVHRSSSAARPTRSRIERGGWPSCSRCRFVGPLLYLAFGRSTIPVQLRSMLTAGGVAGYLVFLALGLVFGS
jgi:hypothetical protein